MICSIKFFSTARRIKLWQGKDHCHVKRSFGQGFDKKTGSKIDLN